MTKKVSDVYKLEDKGKKENLLLRYEFTFQLKRLMQNKNFHTKRYQLEKFSETSLFLQIDSGSLFKVILTQLVQQLKMMLKFWP